jgi:hypothetical protein
MDGILRSSDPIFELPLAEFFTLSAVPADLPNRLSWY